MMVLITFVWFYVTISIFKAVYVIYPKDKLYDFLPGICWLHMAFATHSTNYPCPLKQTTCHKLQTVATERSSHANAVDTCRALSHAILPHVNSPYQRPTNHLRGKKNTLKKFDNCKKAKNLPVGQ